MTDIGFTFSKVVMFWENNLITVDKHSYYDSESWDLSALHDFEAIAFRDVCLSGLGVSRIVSLCFCLCSGDNFSQHL